MTMQTDQTRKAIAAQANAASGNAKSSPLAKEPRESLRLACSFFISRSNRSWNIAKSTFRLTGSLPTSRYSYSSYSSYSRNTTKAASSHSRACFSPRQSFIQMMHDVGAAATGSMKAGHV